ncbi:MAG: response regulator [Deltaproteobacteria bacterium]|nr:response regulator [Deltaproteobacteria bacterium]
MELSKEKLAQLVGVFQAEATDLIRSLTEIFLSLDSSQDKDTEELLHRAFRDAHTLKGAASTLGFDRVSNITHHLEDALNKLKTENRAPSTETVDLLLETLDTLKITVQTCGLEKEDLNNQELEISKRLRAFIDEIPVSEVDNASAHLYLKNASIENRQSIRTLSAFRDKSLDCIRSIATSLCNLDTDNQAECVRLLDQAARNLNSLSQLAESVQHHSVRETSLELKAAVETITQNQIPIERPIADLLLKGLSIVLKAAERNFDEAMHWNDQDRETVAALEELAKHSNQNLEEPPRASSEEKLGIPAALERSPQGPRESGRNQEVKAEEGFLRISERKVDDVIAQVDDLFEVDLQVGSFLTPLHRIIHAIKEIEDNLRAIKDGVQRNSGALDLDQSINDLHGLAIQAQLAAKKFDYDKRQLSKLVSSVQKELRGIRLAPISTVYVTLRRQVRELSKITGKQVALLLDEGEHAVDRRVLDAIEAPINHILRNAIDHGIESPAARVKLGKPEMGRISVNTRHTGDSVELTISDDGRGVDHEAIRNKLLKEKELASDYVQSLDRDQLLDYIFKPGFSTKGSVTQLSGRGVGMDVVRHSVESLGGEVRLSSVAGEGTALTLRLPLAMSTIRCLLFRVAQRIMAIPAYNVEKVIAPRPDESRRLAGDDVLIHKGKNLPIRSIGEILGLTENLDASHKTSRVAIIVVFGERRVAFLVDELVEYAQLILKPLGDLLERVPNVYGISLLATGELALVLNPGDLVRAVVVDRVNDSGRAPRKDLEPSQSRRILVVDDSITTRALEKSFLEGAGFEVVAVADGYQALQALSSERFSLIIADIQMPNMDGLDLTKTIKSRADLAHLPVILVSALSSDQDKKNGMAAGADAYIVKKELTQRDLLDTIDQLL